ncbi:MAG: AI-2E family transporter, partial [Mailhella sp.]|nr:AI-2E family transporter [Mailhella sp.]
ALRAVFIGIVFVACIQGLLTGIGLAFLGVEDSAFWGMMAVFAAVIPVLGTALIWGPMAIVLWVQGSPMSAVILVVWGTVVVSGADSIIRPYFLKTGIETSILVLFLSIICAMSAFGAIGLILGPVLVALAIQAVHESDILAEKEQYS